MTRARSLVAAAVLASVCASGGTSLPKSAAELLKGSEESAANGIQIGRALGALGEAALPDLRRALRDGSVPMQRVALYALGEIGPNQPRVMTEILPFVTEGKSREVRLNALNALGKLGAHAAGAVPTILGSVTDNDGGIRTEARRALVKIGLAALPATDESSKARSGFFSWLRPGNAAGFFTFEGCNDNLKALYPGHTLAEENKHYGRIQANATVAELVRIISSPSKSGFDKDFALKDLARVGSEGKAALPALLSVLANDPGEGNRQLAAQAIGALGADAATATEPLAAALHDREADVRFSAAWALASIGEQSLPTLERVVTGGTPPAQLAAIRALEMMYSRPAWAIVKRYWERPGMRYPYDETRLRVIIGEPR
jgi:HEAT repeat protein